MAYPFCFLWELIHNLLVILLTEGRKTNQVNRITALADVMILMTKFFNVI